MPRQKQDLDKADEQPVKEVAVNRLKGAYQLGGVWYTADHTPITDPKEIQQAHRAMDKADAEAKRKALLGGNQ